MLKEGALDFFNEMCIRYTDRWSYPKPTEVWTNGRTDRQTTEFSGEEQLFLPVGVQSDHRELRPTSTGPAVG